MSAVEEVFSSIGEVRLVEGRSLRPQQLEGVDVLLVRSVTRVDDQLLNDHSLKFVGSATSGVDHVDRDCLARREIPFAYSPGSNADSVVDYVLSAIANCDNKLERILSGSPVGIVGFGHIGKRLQQRLHALGVSTLVNDPWLSPSECPKPSSLDDVLNCEVVCFHAELTREQPWPSYHMLDAHRLESLRPGTLLINAGRGELVDTRALLHWLPSRRDLKLTLDVWEGEPNISGELLGHCLFGTPHIAGYSFDGKLRATHMLYVALCKSLGVVPFKREPTAARLRVHVPSRLHGADLVRWVIAQVYDIADDDARLRAAMPDGFDRLRKNYPRRREIRSLEVSNPRELAEDARALCEAMGCGVG
jgi:erythronate-4-phosphate dehydrogenase